MPVYLGSLGRMIKLPYVGSQQLQQEERYNFSSTLEGKRKAQVKPKGPRTWALSADHFRPNEHSLLSQFANGVWGAGPFVFVPADAPVSNMLTPEVSTCGPEAAYGTQVSSVGEMYIGNDVYAPRSLLNADPGTLMYFGGIRTPIVDRRKVTASAWVKGANARVGVYFYNEAGAFISGSISATSATATTTVRSAVTATPPVGAVSCIVAGVDCVAGAQPAITWTDSVQPWGDGQGCEKAVVHGVGRDQVLAVAGHTYSNVGFTVSEVG